MLTHERLTSLVHYSPSTGVFRWRVYRNHLARAGDVVQAVNEDGYLRMTIDGVKYLCSRLAWFYMTGEWPEGEVDHRDRDRTNNRWLNLREATRQEQNWNRGVNHTSTTGLKGVSPAKGGKFTARIWLDGTRVLLGYFDTADAAANAYRQVELVRERSGARYT